VDLKAKMIKAIRAINKIKKMKGSLEKGSITVEAVFIVSLSLVVIFALLALCFHIHNQAWYTAAAGEAVISGGTCAVRINGDYQSLIEEKFDVFKAGSGFPDNCEGLENHSTDSRIEVSAVGSTKIFLGRGVLKMEIKEHMKVIRPVVLIREIQALELIKE